MRALDSKKIYLVAGCRKDRRGRWLGFRTEGTDSTTDAVEKECEDEERRASTIYRERRMASKRDEEEHS